jgi:cysteine desulfurase
MPRCYLDHAATTPMVGEAIEAMTRQLSLVGNPSSLHGSGRLARRVVEEARESIAARLGALPAEVVFTSGGTEADNLAIQGGWRSARRADPARTGLVVSAIEHHAVLDSAVWMQAAGAELALAPVDARAVVDLDALHELVDTQTALVSVMWANNEVGTIEPIREIATVAAGRGALVHTDAVQAVGHVGVDFAASGVDLLTCTAHKLGGPVGVGALVVRRGVQLIPVQYGGGQEKDLRSGTVDAVGVAGFAAALEAADRHREAEEERLGRLRADLVTRIRTVAPETRVNTPADAPTLPGVVSLTFPGCEAEAMMMLLDAAGIDCATGSACSSGVSEASHVLVAMGRTAREARSTVRFSFGHTTGADDVDALVAALPEAIGRARAAGALHGVG